MVNRINKLVAAAVFSFGASSAIAQDKVYTADEVVAFFADTTNLGADRGLCIIGSPSCDEPEAPAAPRAFDMRVQFELNSADLTPDARQLLEVFAEAANRKELRRAKFNVDGHTDARGEDRFNQSLSERRAEAVVAYLVSHGLNVDRLAARGFGETTPVDANPMADQNRRVEATIAAID